jgi:anti-sigma regulatory factor (Ser/Thr protein kinase)
MREGSRHGAMPGDKGPDRDMAGSPEAEPTSPAHQARSSFRGAPVFLSELAGPDLVIVSATPGTGPALGTRDATLIGRRLADVVGGPEGGHLVQVISRVYSTGNHAYDVPWRTPSEGRSSEPDGAAFSLSVVPVRQPGGSVGGVAVAGLARASRPRAGGRGAEAGDARAGGSPEPVRMEAAVGSAVPAGLPVLPRVRLAARYLPARKDPGAGEAWIDAVVLPQRVIALMTGTAGHRIRTVPGGAAQLRMLLRGTLRADAGPAQTLSYLSDIASGPAGSPGPTAWVAQLDPATGELRYASAGHPMPLVCGPGGEATFLSLPGRTDRRPDGIAKTDVPPGGMLVLYPGTAARPPGGDSTGGSQRRLADLAASVMAGSDSARAADTADRMCAVVAEQLAEWSGGDEVMVLAAHRLREPATDWSMEFAADPQALTGLREGLQDWLEELGVRESDRADLELAVREAAVNATVHGRPWLGTGTGTVRVWAGLDDAGSAVIRVSDRGQWRVGHPPASSPGWSGGRGLSVISQVSDELSIFPSPGGTTVTMRRRVQRPVTTGPAAR